MKILAIFVAKFVIVLTRIFKLGSGTALPGLIAEKIDPNIVRKISSRVKNGVIVVTGTNGKTTTAKMLTEILFEEGFKVLHNPSGSNLTRGIASALIQSVNIFGTGFNSDIAVFEVDEATMPEAMTKLRPRVVVVTNLFRDQLDRYGELDKTAAIIGGSMRGFTDLSVVLNADDPLVADLAKYTDGNVTYFGIDVPEINTKSRAAMDSKDCLECGHELKYQNRYFGHLGVWSCPNCPATRPKLKYSASEIKMQPGISEFLLTLDDEKIKTEMKLPGLYNIYNALAAAAAAKAVGSGGPAVAHALREFSSAFGRLETLSQNGKKATLLLVKNPTGASQALETVFLKKEPKNILLALNDNFADGTDVSWIWDVDFENLELAGNNFICSGIRAEDMALRLKYADVKREQVQIEKDPVKATEMLLSKLDSGEVGYILPTYTAMMEIRNFFKLTGDELSNLGKVTKRGL